MDLHFTGADPRCGRIVQGLGFAGLVAGLLAFGAAPAFAQTAAPVAAPAVDNVAPASIPDPWEGANRKFFKFSMAVDSAVIAPGIHAYKRVVPSPVRTAIKSAVDNLDEPRIVAVDVLQGRPTRAGAAAVRFVANSTVGLGGLIDVAGRTGLPRHEADLGQTFGMYGLNTGPYLFVPFYGPTNMRDGFARILEAAFDPVSWTIGGLDTTFGQARTGVAVAQARVDIDDELVGLQRDFTDPYATLHSAYSQNRRAMVLEARGQAEAGTVTDLPDFGAEPAPEPGAP